MKTSFTYNHSETLLLTKGKEMDPQKRETQFLILSFYTRTKE